MFSTISVWIREVEGNPKTMVARQMYNAKEIDIHEFARRLREC